MKTKVARLQVEGGDTILVRITSVSDETDVAFSDLAVPLERVSATIAGIAKSVIPAIKSVAPDKATVEFGIEISAESGQLAALIAKGTADANLKVTLEWT